MPEANLAEIILLEILRNIIPSKRKFFYFILKNCRCQNVMQCALSLKRKAFKGLQNKIFWSQTAFFSGVDNIGHSTHLESHNCY